MAMTKPRPNILMFGIDSLLATHLSCYGYDRLTSPHIDALARQGTLFERNYSPHIPTTSGYASMLTGLDCFGTGAVALRHRGPLGARAVTLAEILRAEGYDTTCIGFGGNPASRGFDQYIEYESWVPDSATGRAPKAENLNAVAGPELERLAGSDRPFLLFLRHMDPHSPYLPPAPFDRIFYGGDPCDPAKSGMEKVFEFAPFARYFKSWLPDGCTDPDYVIALYDGAIAYMDACIAALLERLHALDLENDTIVVLNSDHGETLYDHDCYFDHHGLYDVTLHVPLILRYPGFVPAGQRVTGYTRHQDLVPTLLELAGIERPDLELDGASLLPMIGGEVASHEPEMYLTECTWMRKHGWRTPEWKLIVALEPDFHFKPPIELYNLVSDPGELQNVAHDNPDVVAMLRQRMEEFIARRERETETVNPMLTQGAWHGHPEIGAAFESSEQAYATLGIADTTTATKLQAGEKQQGDQEA